MQSIIRPKLLKLALAVGLAQLVSHPLHAQHGHLDAGAAASTPGTPLSWANGNDFISSSGYVKTLDYTNSGRYAGYFQQNITVTALPATPANAGPDPAAAGLGAFIRARLACLEAPPGGQFGFWENGATNPTVSLAAGETATQLWALSQNDGSTGSDPYGHIHGRRFTASSPGFYKISFQAVDTSSNGPTGGPVHTPSDPLPIWFQAGVNLFSVEPDYEEGHVHLKLALPAGTTWQVEGADSPATDAAWESVGTPVTGNDLLVEKVLEGDPGTVRFFRLKRLTP